MLTDAELTAIWEHGASVYYKDQLAFARAVCAAQREKCAMECEEFDDNGSAGEAWAMRFAQHVRGLDKCGNK